ncbi:MAG: phosphate ABC transporter substrate-binding protein [Ignavibacteriales bacterium]|nr:phosphate ABC transporter substrate-binding protein [Ignavibacteriales bacterium]
MNWKKILFVLFLLILSCSYKPLEKKEIKIVGSDTMLELTLNLAEQFMKENPGISIIVSGGGTAIGIKALINNGSDICTASRNLKPEEAKNLAEYYGSLGLVFLIAKDALSIYLNPNNPVKNLTLNQLKDIYTGKVKNWKVFGGKDTTINVVTRNPNSGTYLYLKDHILDGDNYTDNSIVKSTTKEVIRFVEESENAIGYGGMGYVGKIIDAEIEGIDPSENNIRNDTYPIIRYLHFFTSKTPDGTVKKFIDWVLSPSGQNIVRQSGFIPLWENKL